MKSKKKSNKPTSSFMDSLISVKPLSAPIGKLYYTDFVYTSEKFEIYQEPLSALDQCLQEIKKEIGL